MTGREQSATANISASNIYKRMIEEIQDYAIILLDRDGIIRNWNIGAEKIKLYTEKEIIGKHFSIFYRAEDIEINLPQTLLNEAFTNGRASHEGWRKRKDGTAFWGNITITAIHDEDSTVIGYCKVTRDLTEKKIAEDQLRRSEERYHQMVAEVQDYAIILLSPAGIIENWNIGAQKIKGYTEAEIVGKHFEVFYTEEDRKIGLPGKLLKIARDKGRAAQEGWRVRKNGTKFWGAIVITALHNKDGAIVGYTKVTRDLSQKKIDEDKLAVYMAELEIQNSELEEFAYVASHDLQEPLRKIRTFSELIRENYDDKEFVIKYFDKLDTSAKRLSELVKSLLNYSRLSVDSKTAAWTYVNLNDVLKEVEEDLELLIADKKATIIGGMLPAVTGSHIQLGQLFSNIIGNSLKFSKTEPIIHISSRIVEKQEIPDVPKNLIAERYHLVEFKDNGIGFDDEYNRIIFSLFKRLHGKQEYSGTGIGLALCKKIVENHKGHISASSGHGHGAVFNVYLPFASE